MLDQSFSADNFRILLDVANRKGTYIEALNFFGNDDIFKESREKSEELIRINKDIRIESKKIKLLNATNNDHTKYAELTIRKEEIKEEREQLLNLILESISSKTNNEDFKLELKKGEIKRGKQLYIVPNIPENYFSLKQIQRNIYKTFGVKQADRRIIISQLACLLNDGFPKIVLRTDITEFYESIPHAVLFSEIEENPLLNQPTKKIIKNLLHQYWNILVNDELKTSSNVRTGIPRGIGLSAYLAELYMRKFDKIIKSLDSVTYYARYVDDIIIIFTPNNRNENKSPDDYENQIRTIAQENFGLSLHVEKTKLLDLKKRHSDRINPEKYEITYLGYSFIVNYESSSNEKSETAIKRPSLQILMSQQKRDRYIQKIKLTINDYRLKRIKYSDKDSGNKKILYQRIRFLTNNYQLFRRKSNVFIGVYFSNEFITAPYNDLKELDDILKSEIDKVKDSFNLKFAQKLSNLSFLKGFQDKAILQFIASKEFKIEKLMSIWRNL